MPASPGATRGTVTDHVCLRAIRTSVAKRGRRGRGRLRCRFRPGAAAWADCAAERNGPPPRCAGAVRITRTAGGTHAGPRATCERRDGEETKSGLQALSADAPLFRHCRPEHPVIHMIVHGRCENPRRGRTVSPPPEGPIFHGANGSRGPAWVPPAFRHRALTRAMR